MRASTAGTSVRKSAIEIKRSRNFVKRVWERYQAHHRQALPTHQGGVRVKKMTEIGTWIPVLTVNTHRGLPYGPFARLWETCPVNTDKGRAYTSLARHSALVKRCASAGPRFTWPCHRPGELGGEPRAARDSLTAQTRPAPWFATRHPGSRGDTLRSTRGQQVAVLKNTGRKHGTRLGGRGRHGSTQLPGSPARKVTTNLRRLLHTVRVKESRC